MNWPLEKYKAIWQVNLEFNAAYLLNEFIDKYSNNYKTVYEKNESWKGVCVYKKGSKMELDKLPELENIVNYFGKDNICGINYFNLETSSTLHKHRDMNGNLLFGIIRIHIPIKTNNEAFMYVEGVKYNLPLGTAWAIDTSGLHSLSNGDIDNRIHLVIDIKKSRQTNQYFPIYSLPVILHLFKFIFIVFIKVLRDVFMNPKSLISRYKDKIKRNS